MNVLQLAKYYPPVYGGIELVEKMMTKAHREHGDAVYICAFSHQEKEETGVFGEVITRIKERINILNAPFSWGFYFSFKKMILKNKIQRIYVHLPNPFMHEVVYRHRRFLKFHGIDVVGVYHSDIVNKSFLGDVYHRYFLLTSSVYDKVLVASDELWQSSPVLTSLPSEKKRVIPFCIEEEEGDRRSPHGFSGKIVTIGRLVPYKGFDFLIEALKDQPYELHIIGDGPLRQSLQAQAGKNIIFHHSLPHSEKNKLLAQSDLVVIGSVNRAEAYGMTIVEAFSKGIPVIAPWLQTGVNFLVRDGVTGGVYKVRDRHELLEKINRIRSNPELYHQLSENCLQFYKEHLTYDKFKTSLLKL